MHPTTDTSELIENNEIAVYKAATIAAGGTLVDHDCVSWTSNRPHWPSYLFAPSPAGNSAEAFRALGGRIEAREVPPFMKIGPSRWSATLETALEQSGFLPLDRRDAGMAMELANCPEEDVPANLSVAVVNNREAARHWATVGFSLSPAMIAELVADSRFALIAGNVGGIPVATAMLFAEGDVGGLYHVHVRQQHRRQGIGRSIALAALREARSRGCQLATLSASPDGEAVYRRLGFRERFRYRLYRWHGCTWEDWIRN